MYPRAAWDPVVLEKAQGGTQEVVLPVREVRAVITGGAWACTQPFTSPAIKIGGGLNRFGWRRGLLHHLWGLGQNENAGHLVQKLRIPRWQL